MDETEELNSDRNVSSTSAEMLDEDWIVELKKLEGVIELQAISETDHLMERHGKEGVIMYGRSPEEKSEFLREAAGLFDFFKKKSSVCIVGICTVNTLVYFEVG